MTEPIASFRDVIGRWPSRRAFAAEIGAGGPAGLELARTWYKRDTIPAEWWAAVVAAADRRGRMPGVTLATLAALAERRRVGRAA